jgi:hypothetical protein
MCAFFLKLVKTYYIKPVCLITGAVRKNVVTRSATDAEVTKHAIRWLNLAADRAARRRVPPPSTPPPE